MSLLVAAPQLLADAASDLAGLGSTIKTANATAADPTTGLLPAAADEISTEIASLFSAHGQGFQRLSAQVAAFHEQFVQSLSASANAYATAEASAARDPAERGESARPGGVGAPADQRRFAVVAMRAAVEPARPSAPAARSN